MIGLDTNVLVRYIAQDDHEQADAATRLIESRYTAESPGYICIPVLAELAWVLAAAYRYKKPLAAAVLRRILRTAEFLVEDRDTALAALRDFETGSAEFVDCWIARRNQERGCTKTYIFDSNAVRHSSFAPVP